MKIKILKDFIGNVNGESVPFTAGEVMNVPDEPAWHFVNGGYAEKFVNAEPKKPKARTHKQER